ncbi:MAG: hypothetical protein KME21_09550 [Desmonostoc vinosum HA7617-LM4]|jgi:hypothetical protein|nr:hypothetical protein [Desmonostoc vinosum HA7617-LM4]
MRNHLQLYPKRLFLCLSFVCGVLGATIPNTVSSQTTPIRILRVTARGGTILKRQESWYLQARDIQQADQKCFAKQSEKFFVSSIIENNNSREVSPTGNGERLRDYLEVTFEKPLPCSQQTEGKDTWFVYKAHVQKLQAVAVR